MKYINVEKVKQFLLKRDNLVILVLTGILLLVIAWPVDGTVSKESNMSDLWGRNSDNINNSSDQRESVGDSNSMGNGAGSEYVVESGVLQEEYIIQNLEQRLEELLGAMQGVGRVRVMITLASSGEKIVEKDVPLERSNIVENDSSGGNRSTNEMYSQEETVYSTNAEGDKIPYVVKENSAVVEGVSVVAEGGDSALVQKNISEVIQALFGIEAHKIKVVKMKQEE